MASRSLPAAATLTDVGLLVAELHVLHGNDVDEAEFVAAKTDAVE